MFAVNERSSCRLQFTITDYDGSFIPVGNVDTASLSIYDFGTRNIIASGVDIKPYIDASGVCSYYIPSVYNVLVNPDLPSEKHVVYIAISGYGLNAPEIRHEYNYYINNMKMIT